MPYTVWHCGVLMGDADLEKNPAYPRQIAGIFRPTTYGLRILPALTGLLSAAADLKLEMQAAGMSEPEIQSGARVEEFLVKSAAGQRVIGAGKTLSELELRDPSGATLTVKHMGFVDLTELREVAGKLGCHDATSRLAAVPADAPHIVFSATLAPPRLWRSRLRTALKS